MDTHESRIKCQSVRRAIELTRLLSTHTASGWRLVDLALETGLDHATAHRILKCLEDEGLATRCPGTRRYTIGALAYQLGLAASPYFSFDERSGSILKELAKGLHVVVFLNVLDSYDSVCIARHDGYKAPIAYGVHEGTRRPLCLSAGGVAIWLGLPAQVQSRVRDHTLRFAEQSGQARRAAILRMLDESRRLQVGINREHIIPGIVAVGVPIHNEEGKAVASLSIGLEKTNLSEERFAECLDRLRGCARLLEESLSHLRY